MKIHVLDVLLQSFDFNLHSSMWGVGYKGVEKCEQILKQLHFNVVEKLFNEIILNHTPHIFHASKKYHKKITFYIPQFITNHIIFVNINQELLKYFGNVPYHFMNKDFVSYSLANSYFAKMIYSNNISSLTMINLRNLIYDCIFYHHRHKTLHH